MSPSPARAGDLPSDRARAGCLRERCRRPVASPEDVVERLAATACGVERDPELLLDTSGRRSPRASPGGACARPLLAAVCTAAVPLAHAAWLSARTCSRLELLVDVVERALRRRASTDERPRASSAVAAGGGGNTTAEPSLSFSSSTTRCAFGRCRESPGSAPSRRARSRAADRRQASRRRSRARPSARSR